MSASCHLCAAEDTRALFTKQRRVFLECRGCGLVWIDPMPTAEQQSAHHEQSYREGGYALFSAAEEARRLISESRVAAIEDVAGGGRLLDVGCSAGEFVEAATRAGFAAEGLDVSVAAVERARSRGLVAYHSAVEDFEPTQNYDTITAFDVIEHLIEPRAFVRRLREWLRPGGTLVLTLPDVSSIYPRVLMRRHWFFYWPDDHLFYFKPATVERLLSEEGFEVVGKVRRAYKTMSLDYVATNLGVFNPRLGRVAHAALRPFPRAFAMRPWKLYAGEMLVVARETD